MRTPRFLAAALTAATLALPVAAQGVFVPPPPSATPPSSAAGSGVLTGQRAEIARELPYLGYPDVDVRRLSNGEVAHIAALLHSDMSRGDVHGHVGTVLRGGGILQRAVDGLIRR